MGVNVAAGVGIGKPTVPTLPGRPAACGVAGGRAGDPEGTGRFCVCAGGGFAATGVAAEVAPPRAVEASCPMAGGAIAGAGRVVGAKVAGMPDMPRPAVTGAGADPATVPGTGCGFENGIPAEGARHAVEDNTDAGVGVPRSPGRTAGKCEGPTGTIGAVARKGGADVPNDAAGTIFAGTGLRPTRVAPATAVMAPGMPMFV